MYKVDIYLILHVSRYNMTVKTSNSESAQQFVQCIPECQVMIAVLYFDIYKLVFRGVNEK